MRFLSFAMVLGFLLSSPFSRPAVAATSTASFGVSATVQSACQASSPATAFGSYATAGRSPVSVTCTNPTPYSVSLSADLSTPAASQLTGTAKAFQDHALLPATANGQWIRAGMATTSGSSSGSPRAYSVFSRTAHVWHVSSGAFADVVTVTITY